MKGSCFKCLKEGHSSIEVKGKKVKSKKTCVYCNEISVHHRSFCPIKFKVSVKKESVHMVDECVDESGFQK